MAKTTLFLRDFTELDYAYFSPIDGLKGDSLYVSAELMGSLDEQGFILDFGPAKKTLKKLVDDTLDHKLVVPKGLKVGEGKWVLHSRAGDEIHYRAPETAVAEVADLSVEGLAATLAKAARAVLPANVESIRFYLREETAFARKANFRYTHGLRMHEGNCQRLIHGHRNPIEVWQDGSRLADWENLLAQEWSDVHFAAASTLLNRAELDLPLGRRNLRHSGIAHIQYSAPQGEFSAHLSASRIVLLPHEPSIENIARLATERLVSAGLKGEFSVRAFEGLNKGATYSG